MKHIWTDNQPPQPQSTKRTAERHAITLPARLSWKDQRGTMRFASVVTRNISEMGVYVESASPVAIPLYRLVQFQLERDVRDTDAVPAALRQGRVLSAVYRVSPGTAHGRPQGIALRLMIDPKRLVAVEQTRATA